MVQNLDNYHWIEDEISEYTRDFLQKKLKEYNYDVLELKCESFITQRIGQVWFTYILNMKLCNLNTGKTIIIDSHDQYSKFEDFGEDNDTLNKIIEDWKTAALKDRGRMVTCDELIDDKDKAKIVIDKESNINKALAKDQGDKKVLNGDDKLNKKSEKCNEEKKSDLKVSFTAKCKKDDLINFIFDENHMKIWSLGRLRNEGNTIIVADVLYLKDIHRTGESFEFEMKLKEWKTYSKVNLKFTQIDDMHDTKIEIQQVGTPFDNIEPLRRIWYDLIFKNLIMGYNIHIG